MNKGSNEYQWISLEIRNITDFVGELRVDEDGDIKLLAAVGVKGFSTGKNN